MAEILDDVVDNEISHNLNNKAELHHKLYPTLETLPQPQNLEELITLLHGELGPQGGLETADISRVIKLMELYQSNQEDWKQYALFDNCKYTRNLVDDGNGRFNLMVLCWNVNQQSAIHDHSSAHCVMKILDGELTESLYEWPEHCNIKRGSFPTSRQSSPTKTHTYEKPSTCERMKEKASNKYTTNQVAYIHDKIGLHRVANKSDSKTAISLHLYSPPFQCCRSFVEDTGEARCSGRYTFFSLKGKKCCPLE